MLVQYSPLLFLGGLGLVLSLCLSLAQRFFFVAADPKLLEVYELLPQSNCGACGNPSCNQFAKKLISKETQPEICTQSSPQNAQAIAGLLQVELGERDLKVARIACQGGRNVALQRIEYKGFGSCTSANLVAGGGKACPWGCLGLGDCAVLCSFGAIEMDDMGLPFVTPEKCTACGDCVDACPKHLFSLVSLSKPLFVACKNLNEGEEAEADCMVACTGCGLCAADAPNSQISIHNFLASIELSLEQKFTDSIITIDRCPTGAIGIWEAGGNLKKGTQAKKVINHQALEVSR